MKMHFLPYQKRWIKDQSPLKIIEKSRQVGLTYADAYDSVRKAANRHARLDVCVSSRDETQAQEYLRHCRTWAKVLNIVCIDLGEVLIDSEKDIRAYALRFTNDRLIYALSSNADAIVGKAGHIKLDEFAVHKHQHDLYRYALPCKTWGGTLAIISTHRGTGTLFHEIIDEIKHRGNPKGFSHHRVSLQDAIEQGIVEQINEVSGREESREAFAARLRAECIDEAQWQQEYCCIAVDDNSAFLSYDLLTACEQADCLKDFEYLRDCPNSLYVGVDVARKHHLCVIDVAEKIGDVCWDRLRLELRDKTFAEIEFELFRLLELRQVKRACIDATGIGMQLAERAHYHWPWKVEPVTFTAAVKEDLAVRLRIGFESKLLRINAEPKLRADLHSVNKQVTPGGNVRFGGETNDSHCDRFWAKALRHHAATHLWPEVVAAVA